MTPSQPTRSKLTALLPTCNEEANIRECLATVAWADEVFVVDSGSSDATPELARAAGARVVHHEYVNSATQKNWAIPQASHGWVLIVDSDERVTPELRAEIEGVLAADARGESVSNGYRVKRLNHFLGQRIRYCGWQNDTCLRLFRRDKGRYQDRQVHADIEIEGGRVGRLKNMLLHYTFTSFDQYMRKFDRYTTLAAGDRALRTPRVRWYHLTLRPLGRFIKQYVLKRGFLDGRAGLIVCALASYSVFLKYAKLFELQQTAENGGDIAESSRAVRSAPSPTSGNAHPAANTKS